MKKTSEELQKQKAEQELSRPKVTVKIPEVRLRLEDLSYLRSLAEPDRPRCHIAANAKERLRFLDLITEETVPPPDSEIKKAAETAAALKQRAEILLKQEAWGDLQRLTYELDRCNLRGTVRDCLTDRGRALLQKGEITVSVRKAGCIR